MIVVIVALLAIIGYALTSPKSRGTPTLKQHAHSSGFVVVLCLLALLVFLLVLANVHVPGQ